MDRWCGAAAQSRFTHLIEAATVTNRLNYKHLKRRRGGVGSAGFCLQAHKSLIVSEHQSTWLGLVCSVSYTG